MSADNKQVLSSVSLGVFCLTLAWWLVALATFHESKPYGGDPGVIGYLLFGMIAPAISNALGLLVGLLGFWRRQDKAEKSALYWALANLASPAVMLPLLQRLIHGTTY